jgi:signal transduction histidine kinase
MSTVLDTCSIVTAGPSRRYGARPERAWSFWHTPRGRWDDGGVSTQAAATARAATVVIAPTAVAFGLIAAGVAARHGDLTTYAGRSAAATLATVSAGWMLIAAGLLGYLRRPGRPAMALAVLAGFAWFAPEWIGWQTGPGAVRALGLATQGVTVAAVAQIALGALTGWAPTPVTRWVLAATWLTTAVVGAGRALFYDPLADPGCMTWCATNPLLLRGSRGLARGLDWVDLGLALALAVALAVYAAHRMGRATPAARRGMWPVVVPAVVFVTAWAVRVAVVVTTPGEDPARTVLAASFAARAAALAALALGLGWSLARAAHGAGALRRLARMQAREVSGGSLQAALVRATGDSSARVAFPWRGAEQWIDAEGEEVDARRRPGEAMTTIVREGLPVAVVMHHPAVLDGALVEREIGTAARLAVDNERLRAEARAQLRELRASRARIVETGDAERRALERDLHDGAQQRLVGLSMAMRMARSCFQDERDAGASSSLADADAALQQAIAELRELARGIHPVELTDEGLAAALETLADRSSVPLRIVALAPARLPAAVETAAYAFVDDVVRRAGRRGERVTIEVRARREAAAFIIEVTDPGETSLDAARGELLAVADRVGALGGHLVVEPASTSGAVTRVRLPCA